MINDRRTEEQKQQTAVYIVATDSFLSGWGLAPRTSYFAVACPNDRTIADDVMERMNRRSDFKRVRLNIHLPRDKDGCHISVEWHENFTYGR